MSRPTEPWDLLANLPERGWIVLRTERWLSLVQLEMFGLVVVEAAHRGVYQVRLTAAGRHYRESVTHSDPSVTPWP